jgi:GDP-L-fucose synthase
MLDIKSLYQGLLVSEVMPREARIYVAGHNGLVGSAIWRALQARGYNNLVGRRSADLDLRDPLAVERFFEQQRPNYVFLAAAKVGGILANNTYPAEFISDNLRIQVNVIDAARRFGAKKLLFLGSSCIYPKFAPQPIQESSLLTGLLEPTNDSYAIAKIAGVLQIQANRRQYGVPFISAMPTNLYGPGDNFDLRNSHVLPALMRKIHDAKQKRLSTVEVWGTGKPRREFLHVDDLARASIMLMERYNEDAPINIGVGTDISILELAQTVSRVIGYNGELAFDTSKPDGTPRKLLDVSRINSLGWKPEISLESGLKQTYAWYLESQEKLKEPA